MLGAASDALPLLDWSLSTTVTNSSLPCVIICAVAEQLSLTRVGSKAGRVAEMAANVELKSVDAAPKIMSSLPCAGLNCRRSFCGAPGCTKEEGHYYIASVQAARIQRLQKRLHRSHALLSAKMRSTARWRRDERKAATLHMHASTGYF